jgi:hypothetical protein
MSPACSEVAGEGCVGTLMTGMPSGEKQTHHPARLAGFGMTAAMGARPQQKVDRATCEVEAFC